MTLRGHCAALLLARRAGELTVGRYDIHPQPEAVFSMVVQWLSYTTEGGGEGGEKHRY